MNNEKLEKETVKDIGGSGIYITEGTTEEGMSFKNSFMLNEEINFLERIYKNSQAKYIKEQNDKCNTRQFRRKQERILKKKKDKYEKERKYYG